MISIVILIAFAGTALAAERDPVLECKEGAENAVLLDDKQEKWTAFSTTAYSITGDITIGAGEIVFENGVSAKPRYLGKWQLSEEVLGRKAAGCGAVYIFDVPFEGKFIRGTPLCGDPIRYLVLWRDTGATGRLPKTEAKLNLSAFTIYNNTYLTSECAGFSYFKP
jgi:hypothetical protein